jgi:hypothetical protein
MTDMTERAFYQDLDNDAAADWTPVASDLSDVDRAWSMAAHLCKMHRYHLDAYLRWGRACINGLVHRRRIEPLSDLLSASRRTGH